MKYITKDRIQFTAILHFCFYRSFCNHNVTFFDKSNYINILINPPHVGHIILLYENKSTSSTHSFSFACP